MTDKQDTPMSDSDDSAGSHEESTSNKSAGSPVMSIVVFVGSVALIIGFVLSYFKVGPFSGDSDPESQSAEREQRAFASVNPNNPEQVVVHYWDILPEAVAKGRIEPGRVSNILLRDYVGSEECQTCHAEIHGHWSKSHHNTTSLMPTAESVKGDFSGASSIDYLGGKATFRQENGDYLMELVRDNIRRLYQVTGTIGGRYIQGYSGRLIEGPEAKDHIARLKDLELPFNYWISRGEWIPINHPGDVMPSDEQVSDPFGDDGHVVIFDQKCAVCHTTRPLGDWLVADSGKTRVVHHGGRPVGFYLGPYIKNQHPEYLPPDTQLDKVPTERIEFILKEMDNISIEEGSVSRGVSCEACHLGARQHAAKSTKDTNGMPTRYFPSSEFLLIPKPEGTDEEAEKQVWGKTVNNLNFMCARCHTDERPRYANEMSISYGASLSDADRGHCYHASESATGPESHLSCVTCHDPHKSMGQWNETPQQEDARCIQCHKEYESQDVVQAHTHHAPGTVGSHCMDCHMPKMVEGRQGVVRTHMIFSPTDTQMLEANQPNACNLCHLDQNIEWTVDHLKKWYPPAPIAEGDELQAATSGLAMLSEERMADAYPNREGKVGLGWLNSPHSPTRLVAVEAIGNADARWALPELVEALDDKVASNRMFAQLNIEKMLGISLDDFGYRYYMSPTERRGPLDRIREEVLKAAADDVPE